jgi:uncharacterized membrane protein
MEFTLLLLIVLLVLTPIFAFAAFFRAGSLSRQLDALRAEVSTLRTQLARSSWAEAPEGQQRTRPEAQPETRPAAEAVFEEAPVAPAAVGPPPSPPVIETPDPVIEPEPAAAPEPTPEPQPAPQPEPVFARTEPHTEQPSWSRTSSQLERTIAANWLIWVGALALALGGIFLVRFAWEQGYFGPTARTIAAIVAGLAMIGASEWMRRKADPAAPGQMRFAPLAVATAGAVTLYAAAYAAGPLYDLVPPGAALAGFVAASVIAVALSVVHGAFLAVLGLIGGYAAPVLVGGATPDPVLLLGYVLAVSAAALFLVRVFGWHRIVWVALIGSAAWTLLAIGWMDMPSGPFALAGYLLALVAGSTWLAWRHAGVSPLAAHAAPDETVIAANGFWVIAAAGLAVPVAIRLTASVDPLLFASLLLAAAGIAVA